MKLAGRRQSNLLITFLPLLFPISISLSSPIHHFLPFHDGLFLSRMASFISPCPLPSSLQHTLILFSEKNQQWWIWNWRHSSVLHCTDICDRNCNVSRRGACGVESASRLVSNHRGVPQVAKVRREKRARYQGGKKEREGKESEKERKNRRSIVCLLCIYRGSSGVPFMFTVLRLQPRKHQSSK